MNNKIAYCLNCNMDVEYITRDYTRMAQIRGITTLDNYWVTCECPHCKDHVFNKEIDDVNYKTLYDAYKKKVGLLTTKEFDELRAELHLSYEELNQLIVKELGETMKIDTQRIVQGSIQPLAIDIFMIGLKAGKELNNV